MIWVCLVAALGMTFDQIVDGLTPDGAGPCVRILDVPVDVSRVMAYARIENPRAMDRPA